MDFPPPATACGTRRGLPLRLDPISLVAKGRPCTGRIRISASNTALQTAAPKIDEEPSMGGLGTSQTVSALKEEIASLKAELRTAKATIRELSKERALAQKAKASHLFNSTNTAEKDPTDVVFLIWRVARRTKDCDQRYIKRDLGRKLDGKQREDVEEAIDAMSVSVSPREMKRFLQRYMSKGGFSAALFLSDMRKLQPVLLLEDVEPRIDEFRCHFAVQNRAKSQLLSLMRDLLPNPCDQKSAFRLLTKAPVSLPRDLAELFTVYLWKGSKKLDTGEIVMEEIPEWETVRDLTAKIRLELALRNVSIESLPSLLPVPLTKAGLRTVLVTKCGLKEDQAMTFAEYLFPSAANSLLPLYSLTVVLHPGWKTAAEVNIPERFSELADYMSSNRLYHVGMHTPAVSPTHISLRQFILECEKEFHKALTSDQRFALELFAYRDARESNFLNFALLHREIIRIHLLRSEVETPVNAATASEEPHW